MREMCPVNGFVDVEQQSLSRKLWQAKVDWLGNPLLTMWNLSIQPQDAFWGDGKANHPIPSTKTTSISRKCQQILGFWTLCLTNPR